MSRRLLNRTLELISACPCENGCPSCVGPTADHSERTKEVALEILEAAVSRHSVHAHEDGRNGMSMRYVSLDRVHGLKALRRSSAASAPGMQASWLNDAGDLSLPHENDPL